MYVRLEGRPHACSPCPFPLRSPPARLPNPTHASKMTYWVDLRSNITPRLEARRDIASTLHFSLRAIVIFVFAPVSVLEHAHLFLRPRTAPRYLPRHFVLHAFESAAIVTQDAIVARPLSPTDDEMSKMGNTPMATNLVRHTSDFIETAPHKLGIASCDNLSERLVVINCCPTAQNGRPTNARTSARCVFNFGTDDTKPVAFQRRAELSQRHLRLAPVARDNPFHVNSARSPRSISAHPP